MNFRRFLIEGATLVISAIILGLVANAMASSDRRVSLAAPEPSSRMIEGRQTGDGPDSTIIEDEAVTSTGPLEDQIPGAPAALTDTATSPPAPTATASKASKSEILERFKPTPDVPAVEIHTDDAEWLFRNGAMFIDARRTSVYNDGHIAGARSMSVWEADVDDKVKALAAEGLDTNMPIVIYCSGGECEDSHMLAQKLWGMFFNNLLVYYEGYPGWTSAGNPIRQGAQP